MNKKHSYTDLDSTSLHSIFHDDSRNDFYDLGDNIQDSSLIEAEYILDTELKYFWSAQPNNNLKLLHVNCHSIQNSFDDLTQLISFSNDKINFICVTETWLKKTNVDIYQIEGYRFLSCCWNDKQGGGVGIFVDTNYDAETCDVLLQSSKTIECLFVEIKCRNKLVLLLGVIYRPPQGDVALFNAEIDKITSFIETKYSKVTVCVAGDFNIDLLKCDSNDIYHSFLTNMHAHSFLPCITKPTRVTNKSATLIDNIFVKCRPKRINYRGLSQQLFTMIFQTTFPL